MGSDPSDRRPSAVLGRISGQSAECSALPVESSFRLAFLAEFEPRSGQLGPLFGAARPSKIMLPPRREHDFSLFVLSRSFDPSDRLLDPILGPLGAILGPLWGLLGLPWDVLRGRAWRAEGAEEA